VANEVTQDPTNPLVEARQLGRRTAAGQWLIRNVNLQTCVGDRLAVVGRSGSGKTLLLRALARLDPVQEGQVFWHDEVVHRDRIPEYRSRVVYLHQRTPLVDGTVEENLQRPFGYAVHGDRRYDSGLIVKWLQSLGRDESFLAKSTKQLSGGEAQITALLRAMQLNPEVLLLDEPTAALDRESTAVVEQLVNQWHGEPATSRAFVLVTHDAEQAQRVAGKVMHMERGHLES
jgi:putative ABC transport system ATP-binding protein